MKKLMKRHIKLNFFQRLFLALLSILVGLCVLITGSFVLYFKKESQNTVNESIRHISQINAQNISQSINQLDLSISFLNTKESGLHENVLAYSNTVNSLITTLDQTSALLEGYISIILRPLTTKYHIYFFVDPSYDIFNQLPEIDIETASLSGKGWLYSNKKVSNTAWYKHATENYDQNHWITLDSEPQTLCLARCLNYKIIKNNQVETFTPGVLFIKMDTSWIQDTLNSSDLTAGSVFLLVDRSGTLLYNSTPFEINDTDTQTLILQNDESFLINGNEFFVQSAPVTSDLRLITLVPKSQLHSDFMRTIFPFLLLFVITFLVGILFSIHLSHRMTRDILLLADHMRHGNLTAIEPKHLMHDEDINLLYQNYNLLAKLTEESLRQKLEYAEFQKEMELNLLQAQINPHFLCNSLNSVYNLAILHNEYNIASALSSLCTYLRYNVSSPNIEVTLQQELDMLEKYISLQNFLCGDHIFFDYDIQAINTQQTIIPKMLLQPLVENCIMHNGENEFIEINITCTLDENVLRLIVKDNGTKKEVDSINSSLSNINTQDTKLKTHGFGISNVHQRIKMKYGEQYGLRYVTSEEGGIVAYIELPACVAVTS